MVTSHPCLLHIHPPQPDLVHRMACMRMRMKLGSHRDGGQRVHLCSLKQLRRLMPKAPKRLNLAHHGAASAVANLNLNPRTYSLQRFGLKQLHMLMPCDAHTPQPGPLQTGISSREPYIQTCGSKKMRMLTPVTRTRPYRMARAVGPAADWHQQP